MGKTITAAQCFGPRLEAQCSTKCKSDTRPEKVPDQLAELSSDVREFHDER
jgi:hypothetical protein